MLSIIGSSGAGKTTLLNTLAGRLKTGTVTGTLLVNGQPLQDRSVFKEITAYGKVIIAQPKINQWVGTDRHVVRILRTKEDEPKKNTGPKKAWDAVWDAVSNCKATAEKIWNLSAK